MGLIDTLKQAGYKPTASSDGEWKPLVGRYKANVVTLRPEKDDQGAKYYQLELKVSETLDGDTAGGGKYPEFKRRYYLDGDKGAKNLQNMLDLFFTLGIEFDMSSDEALEADFNKGIGATAYIRAWEWKKDDGTVAQSWVVQKEAVAQKKAKTAKVPF
jgi:hypothetical protein